MEVTVGLLIGLMPILLTIDSQRIRRPEKREQDKGKNQSVEQSEHTQFIDCLLSYTGRVHGAPRQL